MKVLPYDEYDIVNHIIHGATPTTTTTTTIITRTSTIYITEQR